VGNPARQAGVVLTGISAGSICWHTGAALSTCEAIAFAQRGRGERRRSTSGWESLTPTERASARGLSNFATVEFDLEHIDMPDASFDKVLCREALMLVTDPLAATRETRRVLVPSGRAVFAVWGPPEDNPWLSILINTVSSQLRAPIPPPGMPGPFALAAPGALADVLTEGGFTDVEGPGSPDPHAGPDIR
jgi:SAM-dependent methyltransferase